ncbi:hypothetical protein ABZ829_36105 [Streptomyces xanthochromogenes]|uniref:hypothetical protein n=1 Tax=Streptomyces xanthochromogenes TaxID=67384 RepID=UPI0034405D44
MKTPAARRIAVAGSAVVLLASGAGLALADGGGVPGHAPSKETGSAPPSTVEDFNYPGADRILADKGIKLLRGDGHIVLADCGTTANEVQVRQRRQSKPICFAVHGNGGYLTLDMPKVYGVRGNSFTTEIDMTVDGTTTSYDIDKNLWTNVGETADPDERDHALVEIRSSK